MTKTLVLSFLASCGWMAAARTHAGPWLRPEPKECRGDRAYSPLHYWAPALCRFPYGHKVGFSGHATDLHAGVPNSVTVIRYPCRAVPSDARYLQSGLPYDPVGPYMIPVMMAPAASQSEAPSYPR